MALVQSFAIWFAIIAGASFALYFATGTWLTWLNRRNEARRIQRRSGEHRIAKDIRQSIGQLSLSAALLALGVALRESGYGVQPATGWWASLLAFALLVLAYDAWFYWTHRLLHVRWLYRFHAPHHRSVAPTAWSNDASSSVDTLIAHSFFLLATVLTPAPLAALFAHRVFDQLTGMIGHCGFEHFADRTMRRPFPLICTIYHDQHHSAFNYNYANYFSWWDRWFGTVHPAYDALVKEREATLAGRSGQNEPAPAREAAR